MSRAEKLWTLAAGTQTNITEGKRIAYTISVAADGPYKDGAAVLAHAIRKAVKDSHYSMELIAMVHPSVTTTHASSTYASWKWVSEYAYLLDLRVVSRMWFVHGRGVCMPYLRLESPEFILRDCRLIGLIMFPPSFSFVHWWIAADIWTETSRWMWRR